MLKISEIKNIIKEEDNLPLLSKIALRFGITDFKDFISHIEGFTLGEMLLVMMIIAIFVAVSTPLVTKRTRTLLNPIHDDIWKYTSNDLDIYFLNKVNIGTKDPHTPQLYVRSAGTQSNPQIALNATNNTVDAFLRYGNANKFILGSGTTSAEADGGIAIGHNARTYTANSIAIGSSPNVSDTGSSTAKTITRTVTSTYSYSVLTHFHALYSGGPAGTGSISYTYAARLPQSSGHHYVTVTCPAIVYLRSSTIAAIGTTVTVVPPVSGLANISWSAYSYKTEQTYALYTSELNGAINIYSYFGNGNTACWADIYNTSSQTHQLIENAESYLKTLVDASLATAPGIAIGHNATASSTNGIAIGYRATSSNPSQIVLGTSGSTLYVKGTAMSSDLGLKNIKGLYQRGLKELRKLRTYLFSFKNDEEHVLRAGLIAQDVKKVMPEAISTSDDKNHLAIKHEYINFAMFNAISDVDKSLRAVVKRQFVLERKIAKQEAKIRQLEKTIEELSSKQGQS